MKVGLLKIENRIQSKLVETKHLSFNAPLLGYKNSQLGLYALQQMILWKSMQGLKMKTSKEYLELETVKVMPSWFSLKDLANQERKQLKLHSL